MALSLACALEPAAGGTCESQTELGCIESTECTLHETKARGAGPYACRPAANRCERGFRQKTSTREECEAKPGCALHPGRCYCPPDVLCACGGGPPKQCRPAEGSAPTPGEEPS